MPKYGVVLWIGLLSTRGWMDSTQYVGFEPNHPKVKGMTGYWINPQTPLKFYLTDYYSTFSYSRFPVTLKLFEVSLEQGQKCDFCLKYLCSQTPTSLAVVLIFFFFLKIWTLFEKEPGSYLLCDCVRSARVRDRRACGLELWQTLFMKHPLAILAQDLFGNMHNWMNEV